RPEQGAGGEVQRTGVAEQAPLQRRQAQAVLEREDLHADELREQGVGDEEGRQHQQHALGALLPGHASGSRRSKGISSGLTAPPEMRRDMASATVQSVGVSRSTGTISR